MIVQAALNGARSRSYHPQVPQLAEEIARDARTALIAGANELHIHVYGERDRESLKAVHVDALISAVRELAPGTLIGISTGAWIEIDDVTRLNCIAAWNQLPDHASVNLSDTGACDVIRALHHRGIGVEAGLSSAEDAEKLVTSGLAPLILRILVEVDQVETDAAMVEADSVLAELDRLTSPKPILMHGSNATTWPFLQRAIARRYSVRIGLEDTAALPDGVVATSNQQLVEAAVRMVHEATAHDLAHGS